MIDTGNTTLLFLGIGMVFLMYAGVACFNSGLGRQKEAMNVWANGLLIAAIGTLVWGAYGYSLAFGGEGTFIGGSTGYFQNGLSASVTGGLPEVGAVIFQLMFAILTVFIGFGAFLGRIKMGAMALITVLWLTFSYCPIAHMSWGEGGYFLSHGDIDLAGGKLVHISGGILALTGLYFLGNRGKHRDVYAWNNNLAMIGMALLWVGWPFFNAVSVLAANGQAADALAASFYAPAAGIITWLGINAILGQKNSVIGLATSVVAALAAITPAAGNSGFLQATAIGSVAAFAAWFFMDLLNRKLNLDDTVDVIPAHFVGGVVGGIMAAFGEPQVWQQLQVQITSIAIAVAWCGIVSVASFGIAKLAFEDIRICPNLEESGVDIGYHGENAVNI